MTSKHWVLATEEYLHALGDIELKLMRKITKNNYICESIFSTPSLTAFLTH